MKEEKNSIQKRKERLSVSNSFGKLPPQEVDIEKIVIGTIMQSPKSIINILDLFNPEAFYNDSHKKIVDSILVLYNNHHTIDTATIINNLRSKGELEIIGGAYYVFELLNHAKYEGLRDHMKIVSEKYMFRCLIRICEETAQKAYEDTVNDPFNLITETINNLGIVQQSTMEKTSKSMNELALDAMKSRDDLKGQKIDLIGLSTGWKEIDKFTGGLKKKELTIIAARPAMGKTAIAVNLAKAIGIDQKKPVLLVSIEMTAGQLYVRFQTNHSQVDSKKILKNDLTEIERNILLSTDTALSEAPIHIEDCSSLHVDELDAKVTMFKHKYDIQIVLVDYLGLMTGNGFNKELETGYISRISKKIAKKCDIPVVLLAQLSRAVETRAHKIPMLSDLRDSGSIEQDADNVWFLYRPAYYDTKEKTYFSLYGFDLEAKNLLCIIIAKQREGETGNIPLYANLATMTVVDHPATVSQIPTPTKQQAVQTAMEINPLDQGDGNPF